jgi:hypothetical protein
VGVVEEQDVEIFIQIDGVTLVLKKKVIAVGGAGDLCPLGGLDGVLIAYFYFGDIEI